MACLVSIRTRQQIRGKEGKENSIIEKRFAMKQVVKVKVVLCFNDN